MKLKYEGENLAAFEKGCVYDARKIHDEMGDGYEIRDESEEWYRYGSQFVARNFSNTEHRANVRDYVIAHRGKSATERTAAR